VKVRAKSRAERLTRMVKAAAGPPPPRPRQCRICLADETFDRHGRSSLARGICADRAACEQRQPPLFTEGEIDDRG
jgi:hypothetical protein